MEKHGTALASNFGFVFVTGLIAVGFAALLLLLAAPGAEPEDAEGFRAWGFGMLAFGGAGLLTSLVMYSTMISGARQIRELSQAFDYHVSELIR